MQPLRVDQTCAHLHGKGAKHDGAEDGVPEDAVKDIALAVDFPGVDLVEELHHDEGVEDDGVVFGRRRVQGSVAAAVDVKDLLTWWHEEKEGNSSTIIDDHVIV